MESNNSEAAVDGVLKTLVRNTSLSRLRALSNLSDVRLEETPESHEIMGHWMSLILISGRKLRITFKTQFANHMAQGFAAHMFRLEKGLVSNSQAQDFMREFCNMTAGYLKNALERHQIALGISLPLLTRGFDDFFFSVSSINKVFMDRWKFVSGDHVLYCAAVIEVLDDVVLTGEDLEFKDSGEVEFL